MQVQSQEAQGLFKGRHGRFTSPLYFPSIAEKDGCTFEYFDGTHYFINGQMEKFPYELHSPKTPHSNPRRNPLNNRLILENSKATLCRADGSVWHYSGKPVEEEGYWNNYNDSCAQKSELLWRLDLEVLPSKHRVA